MFTEIHIKRGTPPPHELLKRARATGSMYDEVHNTLRQVPQGEWLEVNIGPDAKVGGLRNALGKFAQQDQVRYEIRMDEKQYPHTLWVRNLGARENGNQPSHPNPEQ